MSKRSYEELENLHEEVVLEAMNNIKRDIIKHCIFIAGFLIISIYFRIEIVKDIKLLSIVFLTIILVFYLMRTNVKLKKIPNIKHYVLLLFLIIFYVYLYYGDKSRPYIICFFCLFIVLFVLSASKSYFEMTYPYVHGKSFSRRVSEGDFVFSKTSGEHVNGNLKEKRILELSDGTHSVGEIGKIMATESESHVSEEKATASANEILSKYENSGFIRFEFLTYQKARRYNRVKMYGGILKSIFFVFFGISFFILGIFGAGSVIFFSSTNIRIMIIVVSFMVLLGGLALFRVRFNRYRELSASEKPLSNKNKNNRNSETLYELSIGEKPIPREIRKPKWPLPKKRNEIPMFDIDDDIPHA